jgi:MFS transporter, DHA1 family, multidrug resistance protein
MSSRSRSYSLTTTTTASSATAPLSSTTTILKDLEAERDESHFETKPSASPLPFLPKTNTDPNLVNWDGPDDFENPQNWSFWYKWWITIVCTVMTLNVYVPTGGRDLSSTFTDIVPHRTFASSAPSSSVPTIAHDFHVAKEVGELVITLFLVGYMLGPIFWGPGSELIGRRPIFIGTLAIYTIFHVGQACANNMTTLLVTRFICGFFAVAPLTNSIGVIADIWDPVNRGIASSVFASAVFLGPVLGPVVGSL